MIARLTGTAPATLYPDFLDALRAAGFRGQLSADYATRTVLATDNSIYQRLPQAAVFPQDAEDIARIAALMAEPRFKEVKLTPRGGGTGTNGQSLTDGIVVDLSRHMNSILEINVEGEVRPQPFVEDTAVPPEQLADYIAEFRALLDGYGPVSYTHLTLPTN